MRRRILQVRRLGRMEYGAAYALQKETEQGVKRGELPDTLLLVEHPHVVTLGRRTAPGALLAAAEILAARGVSLFETNRGGKATYHGLGQVVGYPIINLSPDREDVHRYVRDVEAALIRAVGDFGIEAFPLKGLTGVHTARGKVAAIGIHIARWVTTHGFALNVNTDLSFFNLIVACEGEPVTSLRELLGRELTLREVEDRIIARFAETFEMNAEESGVRRQKTEVGSQESEEKRLETEVRSQQAEAPAGLALDSRLQTPDSRLV